MLSQLAKKKRFDVRADRWRRVHEILKIFYMFDNF